MIQLQHNPFRDDSKKNLASRTSDNNSTRRNSKSLSKAISSSTQQMRMSATSTNALFSAMSKQRSGQSLTENLTATEKKIIRKLKESARAKTKVAPV